MLHAAALLVLLQSGDAPLAASAARLRTDVERLVAFGTRHTLSDTGSEVRGIGAARRWLAAEMERISAAHHGGALRVESPAFELPAGRRTPEGVHLSNVLGFLPGSDPERLVVVSGHYDSRASNPMDAESDAPGANDDGSGTALVLECARLLGRLTPRASVVFLCVAGEEQGLLGSRAQAEAWRAAGFEVEAFLTNDIVGGARGSNGQLEPGRVRLFSSGVAPVEALQARGFESDAPSRQLARWIEELGEAALPDFDVELVFRQDRFNRGGDHKPFEEQGWRAVRFTEPHENYDQQHQDVREEDGRAYGDRIEHVDFEFLARVTAVNARALRTLALAPRPPERVRMDVSQLTPDGILRWSEVPGAAGYRVRSRRTFEPTWSRTQDVGAVTTVVLAGLSPDSWIHAVQSVAPGGEASVPVLARGGR